MENLTLTESGQDDLKSPSLHGISFVIPAYNEEDRLPTTLKAYLPVLAEFGIPYEVIVITDGTDATDRVASAFADQKVICWKYGRKLGRGGAIFEGFRKARYDLVAYADADGSVLPGDAKRIIARVLDGASAAVASRRLEPELVSVPEPPLRRLVGTVWHVLVRFLLGMSLRDAQCGFKVFRKTIVDGVILPRVTISNRTFEVDMLYHVNRAGFRIEEIPVAYVHDFRTRMPIGKAVPVMFLTLIGIFLFNVVLDGGRRPPRFVTRLNSRLSAI